MTLEKYIAQIYGTSLVLKHEVDEDNLDEGHKHLIIVAEHIQKILEKEFIK